MDIGIDLKRALRIYIGYWYRFEKSPEDIAKDILNWYRFEKSPEDIAKDILDIGIDLKRALRILRRIYWILV